MTGNRKILIWGCVSVLALVFIWAIWTPMWRFIFRVAEIIADVFLFFWLPIWHLILGALAASWSAIMSALSIAISAAVSIALLALVLLFGKWALGQVFQRFDGINVQIKNLGKSLGDEALRSGKDALFIALLSLLIAPVAYAATDDFIEKFSTIRFLAVCAFGFCIAKLFIMYPARIAKTGGIAITIAILIGCAAFLNFRYHLVSDASSGSSNLRNILFPADPHLAELQLIKLATAAVMAALSVLAISYPFNLSEWKRMLRVNEPEAALTKA